MTPEEIKDRTEGLKKRWSMNQEIKKTVEEQAKILMKTMDSSGVIKDLLYFATHQDELKYRTDHPKCKRCGKEIYVPMPPSDEISSWGCPSWTLFLRQYVKMNGWYELDNLNHNFVCGDCLEEGDEPNTFKSKFYEKWLEKYIKWRKINGK